MGIMKWRKIHDTNNIEALVLYWNFAIFRREELGYKGRIGLHSLPGALDFYRKLRVGLINCDADPDETDNLVYFETLRQEL
jgi:hypothetical protein